MSLRCGDARVDAASEVGAQTWPDLGGFHASQFINRRQSLKGPVMLWMNVGGGPSGAVRSAYIDALPRVGKS